MSPSAIAALYYAAHSKLHDPPCSPAEDVLRWAYKHGYIVPVEYARASDQSGRDEGAGSPTKEGTGAKRSHAERGAQSSEQAPKNK